MRVIHFWREFLDNGCLIKWFAENNYIGDKLCLTCIKLMNT
jgi:hypothetical protein